jgi:hypothetical protein
MRSRIMAVTGGVLLLVAGCGGGEPTIAEYIEALNASNAQFSPRGEAMWTRFLEIPAPTLGDAAAFLDEAAAFRREIQETVWGDLVVPAEIADVHDPLESWHTSFVEAVEQVAARASTVSSLEELVDTSEFRTYQEVFLDGARACSRVEETLNSPELRGAFAGTAWVPNDLRDAVLVTLPCEMPDDLASMFLRGTADA